MPPKPFPDLGKTRVFGEVYCSLPSLIPSYINNLTIVVTSVTSGSVEV